MANHYDIKYLAKLLNVSEREFHSQIKPLIVRDFQSELKRMGVKNPDILLDENHLIYLADPTNHKVPSPIATNVEIFSYIYDEEDDKD